MQTIHDYYDKLAKDYDSLRFNHSYGRYVDHMEREVLSRWLSNVLPADALDVGCGTGRLLDFAMTGTDTSAEMLKVAGKKFPQRVLLQASLPNLESLPSEHYQAATCFHVFMHFDDALIQQSFNGIARVVKTGGILIMDIPSHHRRALKKHRASETAWHGNTSASYADIQRWAGSQWRITQRCGILFFPIHRLPVFMRPLFAGIDKLIGRTPLSLYSSYHLYKMERI